MNFLAGHFLICTGSGEGITTLNALDQALLNAGVGNFNLLRVTSILPPRCQYIESIQAVSIPFGSFVPCAYASLTSQSKGERISSAVACAIPQKSTVPGVIMECSDFTEERLLKERVVQMAEEALEKVRGEKIQKILSGSATLEVQTIGAVFSAVILWK